VEMGLVKVGEAVKWCVLLLTCCVLSYQENRKEMEDLCGYGSAQFAGAVGCSLGKGLDMYRQLLWLLL